MSERFTNRRRDSGAADRESEFGYERGAYYAGGTEAENGPFEVATRVRFFSTKWENFRSDMQVKFLRVLQEQGNRAHWAKQAC